MHSFEQALKFIMKSLISWYFGEISCRWDRYHQVSNFPQTHQTPSIIWGIQFIILFSWLELD